MKNDGYGFGMLVLGVVFVISGAGAVLGEDGPGPRAAERERPNIIFIFTDDHAYQSIGAYGSEINETPNIDRLAEEGMRFDNCFVTNSLCGPMRAVIQTGKYSHLNGFMRNGNQFDGSQQTFPKLLQQAGYQTAVVGKWHLGTEPRGYDYHEVLIGQGPYYNPPMLKNGERVEHVGYTTDIITDLTLDWLKEGREEGKPFMLMYQHKAPHRNWQPGPDYLTMYDGEEIPEPETLFDDYEGRGTPARTQDMTIEETLTPNDLKLTPPGNLTPEQLSRWNEAYEPKNEAFREADLEGKELVRWKYQRYIKDYLRSVASVDDNIGRVLDYLEETGLDENTIVIYSSDQGFYLGEHGWFDKRWMYEESLRTPFIVRWPGVVEPGSENEDIVSPLDFPETFLDIAGTEVPADMQGASLVPILNGRTPDDWRESFYYHYYEYPGAHSVRKHFGVTDGRYKLIRFYEPDVDEWELYDLKEDPREMNSVYDDPSYAGVVEEMKAELTRLQEQYQDTNPTEPVSRIMQRRLRERAADVELEEVVRMDRPGAVGRKPDPSVKPLTVGARATPEARDGVIVAQGGVSLGYVLYLDGGVPKFAVRGNGELAEVTGEEQLPLGEPVRLAGVLDAEGELHLYVNGEPVASAPGLYIPRQPNDGLSIGADTGSRVGEYDSANEFKGELRDIRLYWGALDDQALQEWAADED